MVRRSKGIYLDYCSLREMKMKMVKKDLLISPSNVKGIFRKSSFSFTGTANWDYVEKSSAISAIIAGLRYAFVYANVCVCLHICK